MVLTEGVSYYDVFRIGFILIDSLGKSDPFVLFTLNGTKVYKSQTKKRTLSPEWDESFMISVVSCNFF